MEIHNHNLNIHYSSPEDIWDKLDELYSEIGEPEDGFEFHIYG